MVDERHIATLPLEELLEFKTEDLVNPAKYKELEKAIRKDPQYMYELGDNSILAEHLQRLMSSDSHLFTAHKDLEKKYGNLINYLRYLRLPVDITEDIYTFIKSELVKAIKMGIDVLERLDLFFTLNDYTTPQRLIFNTNLLRSLKNNTEKIGERDIRVKGERAYPTVKNWLIDYDNFSEEAKEKRTELDRIDYTNTSPNPRHLSPAGRKILLAVLEIYDIFKYPQEKGLLKTVPPAHELPLPFKTLDKIEEEKKGKEKKVYSQEEIYRFYQGDSQEQKQITEREEHIKLTTQDQIKKIIDQLYLLVSKRLIDEELEKMDVLASLQLLAKKNKLADLFKEDSRFYELFNKYLVSQGQSELVRNFRMSPNSPLYIQRFLEWILVEKMKLRKNEAARIGLRLGNLLKQAGNDKYMNMAYFDMATGEFRWQK